MKSQPTLVISEVEYAQLVASSKWLDSPDSDDESEEVAFTCPVCRGDGRDPDGDPGCPDCQGTGIGRYGDPNTSHCRCGDGRASKLDPQCPECEGHGYRWLEIPVAVAIRLAQEGKLLDNPTGVAYDPEAFLYDYDDRDD